ncbi:MAG: glycogen/starch/alpha-glucan phosphorylase [Firmicutes bacterium]|nr:glycogen/starch/alpha-glucan phosphorylase [Bacillota bacterium]
MAKKITKEEFKQEYLRILKERYSAMPSECTPQQKYKALVQYTYAVAAGVRQDTIQRHTAQKPKKVYYFSMEFLIGQLLENYLINLGIRDVVEDGLWDLGEDFEDLCAIEPDPGLGNGGLGRLAACFLDSMATEGISGVGMGLRYRFGLFRQRIESGYQIEEPDAWLSDGFPWEMKRMDRAVEVHFGGYVDRQLREDGKLNFEHKNYSSVMAVPYYIPIVGYGAKDVNVLKLWKAQPAHDAINLDAFNRGDYKEALAERSEIEAITSLLYPNDNQEAGKYLRLKQEYFLVSAGVQSIFREYKDRYGNNRWAEMYEHVSIHTNDTHPALCIPEMMRILLDEKGFEWDEAWEITTKTCSFTNHTILPEALEKWPQDMMRSLLPRIYLIIEEIDRRWSAQLTAGEGDWREAHKKTAVLWDGNVRMADLSIIGSHSVNGVSTIHTEILKNDVFKEFYRISPEKFNNKTNGVTQRRFLIQANPALTGLITDAIGQEWKTDMTKLQQLKDFGSDSAFLDKLQAVKRANKVRLANYIAEHNQIAVNPDSMFDVQVKRIHAYKRQLLNAFKVLDLYFRLKDDPNIEMTPCTFIFAGKAAPGYIYAKEIIKFICSVADLVNGDPVVREKLKVIFVENFSLSNAQLIYPATDISEQISTAGTEASGTGNMKFMMNGAMLLGTLDGANVEILEQVGPYNIKIFGMTTDDIEELNKSGSYHTNQIINSDQSIRRIINSLVDGSFDKSNARFWKIYDAMVSENDQYFVLKDLPAYEEAWDEISGIYRSDRTRWNRISLNNIASSGFFSSDRTIREYAEDIWHINGRAVK